MEVLGRAAEEKEREETLTQQEKRKYLFHILIIWHDLVWLLLITQ
jgi:hypothetical protein